MNAFIPIELIEQQVLEAMREAGIPPLRDTRLVIDGALHRYAVEGDKGRETAGASETSSKGWKHIKASILKDYEENFRNFL